MRLEGRDFKRVSQVKQKMFILRGEFEFFCETAWQKSIVIKNSEKINDIFDKKESSQTMLDYMINEYILVTVLEFFCETAWQKGFVIK